VSSAYPFEKFSAESKQVLVGTQREAERSGNTYVGTEHLLLAMLQLKTSVAHRVLTQLGISYKEVERRVSAAASRTPRRSSQQVTPTSRTKRVIELAFIEADAMNQDIVDSAHLLMGLALEGEGIAALVLEDLGASPDRVIAEVERQAGVPLSGRGKLPAANPPWTTDRPETPEIIGLRDRLASVRFALKQADEAMDSEHARKLAGEEARLLTALERARRRWLASLG